MMLSADDLVNTILNALYNNNPRAVRNWILKNTVKMMEDAGRINQNVQN